MSPMCTYSAVDGHPGAWHLVHLGARAVGGAGLIVTEALAVEPRGRISPDDCGLWDDSHAESWRPIIRFLREHGAVAGAQLAHAGRKASTRSPWQERAQVTEEEGGWQPVGPSPVPFRESDRAPLELRGAELDEIAALWTAAAERAREAGFQFLELHMAHGYLMHQFLSPLVNRRDDDYGGSLENRMRFPLKVAGAVRAVWPPDLPLAVRISVTDWAENGWNPDEAIAFCRKLGAAGVDLIDCSSGGAVPWQQVPMGPGYQIPFAERIRRATRIPTAAVGMITEPALADEVVRSGRADLVLIGREILRDPYWPLRAAIELGRPADWPLQYGWAVG